LTIARKEQAFLCGIFARGQNRRTMRENDGTFGAILIVHD
jgi:hypothetical protein